MGESPNGNGLVEHRQTRILACVALASAALCALALAGLGFWLWPTMIRVNTASAILLNCKGNAACLPSQMLALVGALKATAGAAARASPEIATAAKQASAYSVEASKRAAETAAEGKALMEDLRLLVGDLRGTVQELHQAVADLSKDLSTVAGSADSTVQQASRTLAELEKLIVTLDIQIRDGSPDVQRTLKAMALLMEDPALARTLANVNDASYHGSQVIETVDVATRGLREKAGRVKWLISKIAGMVKMTMPLF